MLTRTLRLIFGIMMIVIYLGMSYLLMVNFFDWSETTTWNIVRYAMATIFGLYGIYRAYRQVTGIDYYRNRSLEDNKQETSN